MATPTPEVPLEKRTLDVEAELAAARGREAAARSAGEQPTEALLQSIALLEQARELQDRQVEAEQRHARLVEEAARLERDIAAGRSEGPPREPVPFPMLEADRDALEAAELQSERLRTAVVDARTALSRAEERLEERARERRRLRAELEAATGDERPTAAARLRRAELVSLVASESVHLRRRELQTAKLQQEVHQSELVRLRERLARTESVARFTADDLGKLLVELETEQAAASAALDTARSEADYHTSRWLDLRRRFDAQAADAPPADELDLARLHSDIARERARGLDRRHGLLLAAQETWRRRWSLFQDGAPEEQLSAWADAAQEQLQRIRAEVRLAATSLESARTTLASAVGDVRARDRAPRSQDERRRSIAELIAVYEAGLSDLEAAERLQGRLLDEIEDRQGGPSRLSWDELSGWLAGIWDYEVVSVADRPLTVGGILVGLLIALVGFVVAGLVSRVVGRRLLPRIGFGPGASAAIERIGYYALVVAFGLLALHVVHVPLTAFTLLGGALAIGLGFGSQAVINNFLSGLILLIERPINVGDLIQLEDLYGTVEKIGPRSTRVRTGNNIEIVVPNSSFLEQNVVNWTLSENRVRISVAVGVIYGSPTRTVAKLLERAVHEHGRVLATPGPVILFTDFGDNALNFEVHFWIQMRSVMDRRMIESDVRFRIDSLFREAGLVIAFPQRDVHLDATRPLPVRILRDADEAAADGEDAS